MNARALDPSERLIEQAIALIVDGEGTSDSQALAAREALARWRARSPRHETAACEAMRRWNALAGLGSDLRSRFPAPERTVPPRRRALLSVAAVLGAGLLGGRAIHWYREQPLFTANYTTRTAELLKVTLPEDSRLDLAPLTGLTVALHRDRRVVTMSGGEVRFDVARDLDRPFSVLTRTTRIEVVGTAFTVRDRGGVVTVGVERGHVRVRRVGDPPGAAIDLRPGQAVDAGDSHVGAVRETAVTGMSAWREGWLVFDNTPLVDALATVNAWRRTPIAAPDPRVRTLRLSGRFRADDSAGLLAVLPTILPVTVMARQDGGVELVPR